MTEKSPTRHDRDTNKVAELRSQRDTLLKWLRVIRDNATDLETCRTIAAHAIKDFREHE